MRSIFMLRHKASTPYNFNIQFPMYTKFITHVYDVAPPSMHQYCVISIVPPTATTRQAPTATRPDAQGLRGPVHHCLQSTFRLFSGTYGERNTMYEQMQRNRVEKRTALVLTSSNQLKCHFRQVKGCDDEARGNRFCWFPQ